MTSRHLALASAKIAVTNYISDRSLLESESKQFAQKRTKYRTGSDKQCPSEESNNKDAPDHSETYYEELASQEEIYLEEREERARAVLISEGESLSLSIIESNPLSVEQLDHAAEELIAGDSDDPPLSEVEVVEMLIKTQIPKPSSL